MAFLLISSQFHIAVPGVDIDHRRSVRSIGSYGGKGEVLIVAYLVHVFPVERFYIDIPVLHYGVHAERGTVAHAQLYVRIVYVHLDGLEIAGDIVQFISEVLLKTSTRR